MAAPQRSLKTIPIKSIKFYTKNPRTLSSEQEKQLSTSISSFGLIDKPIVNSDLQLIGGHQRIRVLSKQGIKEVECWHPDRKLTDKEVEELVIRLNKNTGEWDFETLANSWEIDDLIEWGFDEKDFHIDISEETDIEETESKTKTHTCPNCGFEY